MTTDLSAKRSELATLRKRVSELAAELGDEHAEWLEQQERIADLERSLLEVWRWLSGTHECGGDPLYRLRKAETEASVAAEWERLYPDESSPPPYRWVSDELGREMAGKGRIPEETRARKEFPDAV